MNLLARLIEAGTPADLVAEVAMELARAEAAQEAIQKRRARDRDRQRAHRDNVMSRDNADVTVSTPAPFSPPDPPLSPTPVSINPRVARAREADPFPRPDWADPQVWADLLTNRRKKNLPNTASAHRKLLADVEKLTDDHWPPGRVLEAAVSRGWGAIYAGCKDDDDGRRGNTNRRADPNGRMGGHQPAGDGLSPTTRAALRVFGPDPGHPH